MDISSSSSVLTEINLFKFYPWHFQWLSVNSSPYFVKKCFHLLIITSVPHTPLQRCPQPEDTSPEENIYILFKISPKQIHWFSKQGFIGAPAAREQARISKFSFALPHLFGERQSLFLTWGEGWSRGQFGGVPWVVCPYFRWYCVWMVGRAVRLPLFLLLLQLFKSGQLGFWYLCISLSRIGPKCAHLSQLFLAPHSFFVFCCWRERCVQCNHYSTAATGPRFNLSTPEV